VQAQEAAKARHFMGLVSEQSKYNLICRTVELEVLPACTAYGVGVIPYSPLAGGLLGLAGREQSGGGRRHSEWARRDREKNADALVRYEAFCRELGKEPADVAVAWLLANPAVTSPIIGPRTIEQLDTALLALDVALGQPELERLDAIFPGPGKPAPEAYAW
jgi:aryl-alcohol dehydrogenase-like predicted oxidoreductase